MPERVSNMKFDPEIERELNEDGVMPPPWVTYPGMSRFALGWRVDPYARYLGLWRKWSRRESRDWLTYFKSFEPIPHSWAAWPLEMLGHADDLEVLDEDQMAERVRELGLSVDG